MKITCVELEGATYQPDNIFQIKDFWIIPTTKKLSIFHNSDLKLLLLFESKPHYQYFVFCYQFLFLKSSIYNGASLHEKPRVFNEDGTVDEIAKKHITTDGITINFEKIETFYTDLDPEINFSVFYNDFVLLYQHNDVFKDIIDLFLYTSGTEHKFYNNIFQKISNLQTIFETLTGQPDSKKCSECGCGKYAQTWDVFLKEKLKEKGIDNDWIALTVKIKGLLNKGGRNKFIHSSKQMSTRQKMLEEIQTGDYHYKDKKTYTTNLNDILTDKLKMEKWAALDWENVFSLYKIIIKRLIYLEYFPKKI